MNRLNSFFVFSFLFFGGIVIAEEAAAAVDPEAAKEAVSIWSKIGMGALGGVIASFVGWMKNRDTKTDTQENFDFKYLLCTVVVGAGVGALGAWQGIGDVLATLHWAEQSFLYGGIVAGGEMALKAIWRQGAPRLRDILSTLKGGAQNPTATPPKP